MHEISFSQKLVALLSGLSGITAYGAILGILLACGLGVPVPEDIILIAAGILAGLENISLTGALIAGFCGVLAGDIILFFLGRKFGKRVLSSLSSKKSLPKSASEKLNKKSVKTHSSFVLQQGFYLA